MRPYYLCSSEGYWYMQIAVGLEGILKAIKKTDLNSEDAARIVNALRERGLIDTAAVQAAAMRTGEDSVLLTEFLETFWDYHASPYVREKLAHRHSIGKRHCYESMNRVRRYWFPAFPGKKIKDLTKADLKAFSLSLAEKGLAPGSINKIVTCGSTALGWAAKEGIIPLDPAEGLMKFTAPPRKRGVLTPEEAAAVFAVRWKDKRAYTGNLLAITTGMRSGEILALKKSDVSERTLYVRRSWSALDGLKSTKNGEERKVPLLPEVREKLLELLRENPHHAADPFVFYGLLENRPMDNKMLLDGLKAACGTAGIDARARGIVFHSHRHYFAARMADKMTADQITRVTGHKSLAVFERYADHVIEENIEEVGRVGAEVFGNILQFRKGA